MNFNYFRSLTLTLTLTLALTFLLLTLTWVLSLRPVRLKIGDYYFARGNYDQAVNWYERILRREGFKVVHGGANLLNYESDLTKFKAALERLNDENLLAINYHLDIEKAIDVNLRSAIRNLLMDLDFSNTVTERNYVWAWEAQKVRIKNLFNNEIDESGNYVVSWTKEKLKIEGSVRLVDGPFINSKALVIEGSSNLTKIFGPTSAINPCEGTLAVWARLIDPNKIYSNLVAFPSGTDPRMIYICHQGADGKFMVSYNSYSVGMTSISIKDNQWHHYAFTWKDHDQRFYIDGLEVYNGIASAYTAHPTVFAIGWLGVDSETWKQHWHGPFCQFMTFDRSLTEGEVTALYQWRRSLIVWRLGGKENR